MAVFTKTLRKHIFIHPGDQHKIQSAVRMVLMGDRKKFSERMGGALLDVNNIKVIGDHHLAVHGFMSLEVVADFKIFSPTVGMTLQGRINKVHTNYCGCVSMDYFNASLSYPSSLDAPPRVGDVCSFVVKSLVVNGDMLHLKGQLESIDERAQPVEDTSQTDTLPSPKEKHKKKSKRDSETSKVDDQLLVENSETNPRQNGEEETSNVNECDRTVNAADISTNSDEKKEKKHKKKHKSKHKEELLESSTNECDTSGVVLSTDSVLEGEIKSPKKKHKKKVKDEEVKLESSVSEFDSTINTSVGITGCGDSILENNDTHSAKKKKHKKKRKEEALEATEETQTTIKSEVGMDGDSLLQNDDEDSTKKKKHKKKSKENSLESSMEVEGCDTNVKLEISTTGDSFIGNDDVENSAKKKHKKKRKENSLEKSVDSITAFNNSEDEFVTAVNDSGVGNSEEKHKKSKEEKVLEQSLSLSNGDASFNGDTEMHGSKSEKKEKKKHKKRRRSEEDGDVAQSVEAEFNKSKRLKEEVL